MISWLITSDPVTRHLHHVWTTQQVTEKGLLAALLVLLGVGLVFQLLWWLALRPLIRRRRARTAAPAPCTPPEAPEALGADLVPQFGVPVTLLFDPAVHGPLTCASGVRCGYRRFTAGEAFFRIAEAGEHHPMVAVCTQDVVLRNGTLDGREWTDEPADLAPVYFAPRAVR